MREPGNGLDENAPLVTSWLASSDMDVRRDLGAWIALVCRNRCDWGRTGIVQAELSAMPAATNVVFVFTLWRTINHELGGRMSLPKSVLPWLSCFQMPAWKK